MSSAEDVQNTNGILTLPRFQKCMGRVLSDQKIPGDMSDEGKCTVHVFCKLDCMVQCTMSATPEVRRQIGDFRTNV
eukprot:COSAG02_NODE_615_length_19511_cov_64.132701_18_plen_76_part_00